MLNQNFQIFTFLINQMLPLIIKKIKLTIRNIINIMLTLMPHSGYLLVDTCDITQSNCFLQIGKIYGLYNCSLQYPDAITIIKSLHHLSNFQFSCSFSFKNVHATILLTFCPCDISMVFTSVTFVVFNNLYKAGRVVFLETSDVNHKH